MSVSNRSEHIISMPSCNCKSFALGAEPAEGRMDQNGTTEIAIRRPQGNAEAP
jgi:hypothetical protein